jgi:hypothetical protein
VSRPRSAAERGGSDRRRRERARRAASDPADDATTRAGRAAALRQHSALRDRVRDRDLAPGDRGPVRAFVRDEVDSRRRLVGLFLPVLGAVVISTFSPASDLQRYLLFGSLAALAAVLTDAVLMGVTITRAARAAFPGEPVPGLATGWYAFLRAHRSRNVRRPRPRVSPGDVPDLRAR